MAKRLFRSREDRMIWGVCGGLAKYFDIDPTIVRIIFVLLLFANGIGVLAYLIIAIVVPLEGSKSTAPREAVKENAEELKDTARELGRELHSTFADTEDEIKPEEADKIKHRRRNALGIILIAGGIVLLLGSLNLFTWLRWMYLWPLILVAVGLIIIFSTRRK